MNTTLAKCPCNHCSEHLEFEAEHAGETIACPHCGMETLLFVPQVPKPPPVAKQATPANCPICGNIQRKNHGVFYYVFFGVLSLMATIGILSIIFLLLVVFGLAAIPAFVQASHRATVASVPVMAGSEKGNYIANSIDLYEVQSRYYKTDFEGTLPGVEFKLRNRGNRTLDEVEVTTYFLDSQGRTIAESKYYPVLVSGYSFGKEHEPLKPNYIWQIERGKFYTAKNVPSEWKEGEVKAVITDIKFSANM